MYGYAIYSLYNLGLSSLPLNLSTKKATFLYLQWEITLTHNDSVMIQIFSSGNISNVTSFY